ncbi:metallophosphoesterase [Pelagibius litoralis]|uniref:Metallophosphoesterase n=1 Tax=Pelagibius litoralis TaxID=374515 RepID=A0A967F1U9_9PROT|nr:metallophosphoesterase [Pelagibius litoralis]
MGPLPPIRVADLLNKRFFGYLSWLRRRRALHRPEVLAALAKDLAVSNADHLVITGDLTNIALIEEFAQVEVWLQSLGSADRVTVIPGNHDAYVAVPWETTLAKWQAFMADEPNAGGQPRPPTGPDAFPFVRFRGPAAILGLSSAQPTPLFCAHGTLGEAQLHRLGQHLQKLGQEGWFRVVLLHHPPSLEGIARRKRLVDAEPFRKVIAEHGAELILHGHDHKFADVRIPAGRQSVPVLGVPSASAAHSGKKPQAHYQTYAIAREDGHWRIEVTARGLDPVSGRFAEARRYTI